MIRVIFSKDVAAEAPERWAKQYENTVWPDKQAITKILLDLPAEKRTHEVVRAIIGNDSWTTISCDECGEKKDALVTIGIDREWDCEAASVCAECLAKATALLSKAEALNARERT